MSKKVNGCLAADPEFIPNTIDNFAKQDWGYYSEHMERLGSKDKPLVVNECAMHADGVFAEIAIPPCASPDSFIRVLDQGVQQYSMHAGGYDLVGRDWLDLADHAETFTKKSAPFLYAQARTFGCSPDFIRGRERTVPKRVIERSLREAGFHIHMDMRPEVIGNEGYTQRFVEDYYEAISFLHEWNHPTESPWYRRPMVYRPKPYGIEYRSIGAGIYNDKDKLHMLLQISFDFMNSHLNAAEVFA